MEVVLVTGVLNPDHKSNVTWCRCNCVHYLWRSKIESHFLEVGVNTSITSRLPSIDRRKTNVVASYRTLQIKLRDSASSFHWLSSSVFSYCSVVRPASVTSPLISTIWCFRAYKPYIFCEDMILATCQCQHIFCCWVEPSLLLSSSFQPSILDHVMF